MFGQFSKKNNNIDKKRPDFYNEIVTQKEYETILDFAIESSKQIGDLLSVSEGTITIKNPTNQDGKMQFHLDNLVRRCRNEEIGDWQNIIANHFKRFSTDPNKTKYIYKDIDFASQMLRILVRSINILDDKDDFIHRIDLPETVTFLILDYDEAFHYVRKDEIEEWNKTEKELFEIAKENIASEEIEIKELLWKEEFEAYTFFSDSYSASYIVDLANNADFAIGKYGSVVAIPTSGTAIIHPLNGNTALDFITSFDQTQQEFFNEDEVPITDKYFWFYENRFELFFERVDDGKIYVSLPNKLVELLSIDIS